MANNEDSQDVDSMSDFDENEFLYKLPSQNKPKSISYANTVREIEAQKIEKRELLKVQFSKKRKEFGGTLNLHDKENDLVVNTAPLNDNQFINYVRKKINEIGLQAAQETVEKAVQTNWAKMVSTGFQTRDPEEWIVKPNTQTVDPKESKLLALDPDSTKFQQTKAFNDKLLKFLKAVAPELEKALTVNETVDVFANDFLLIHDQEDNQKMAGTTELSIIKEEKSFEYPDCKKKSISCIRFQPVFPGQKHKFLATSFVENLTFDERIEISGRSYKNQILLWDYQDLHLFTPLITLVSSVEIVTFDFKPGDPNIVVAGAINGQVILWDLNYKVEQNLGFDNKPPTGNQESQGPEEFIPPVMSLLPELYSIPPVIPVDVFSKKNVNSHRGAVQSLKFFPKYVEFDKRQTAVMKDSVEANAEVNQLVTCSSDGQLLFWEAKFTDHTSKRGANKDKKNLAPDYKNAQWKAVFSIQLFKPEGGGPMGCSQITFNKVAKSFQIYGTSDEGDLFELDWSTRASDETGRQNLITDFSTAEKNGRPTIAVEMSPFYDDLLMTIHDCHFCIWKLHCPEPVFVSPFISSSNEKIYITCGFFSPSRQGVLYIGRADGIIDVWDFMDQSKEPTQQHFVVASGITSMEICSVEKDSPFMAVGDSDGCLHLLTLPVNLRKKTPGEQEAIAKFFENEMERVNYFKKRFQYREETRVREEAEQRAREEDEPKIRRRDDDEGKRSPDQIIEDNYQKFVREFFGIKEEAKPEEGQ